MHSLSTPTAAQRALHDLVDRALNATKELAGNELAAQLRVSESYVTKLRKGFRPDRMNQETRRRLTEVAGAVRERSPIYGDLVVGDAQFIAGALWAIEQGALGIAKTASAARERLTGEKGNG